MKARLDHYLQASVRGSLDLSIKKFPTLQSPQTGVATDSFLDNGLSFVADSTNGVNEPFFEDAITPVTVRRVSFNDTLVTQDADESASNELMKELGNVVNC